MSSTPLPRVPAQWHKKPQGKTQMEVELKTPTGVSSTSHSAVHEVLYVKPSIRLPRQSTPVPIFVRGTREIGRHVFSARECSPPRHRQPPRSQTAANTPKAHQDIASWQISQRITDSSGPVGVITQQREFHVSGNAVSFHERCSNPNSVASTPQAGPSSQRTPTPSWGGGRTLWKGSPWAHGSTSTPVIPVTCLLYTSDAADE